MRSAAEKSAEQPSKRRKRECVPEQTPRKKRKSDAELDVDSRPSAKKAPKAVKRSGGGGGVPSGCSKASAASVMNETRALKEFQASQTVANEVEQVFVRLCSASAAEGVICDIGNLITVPENHEHSKLQSRPSPFIPRTPPLPSPHSSSSFHFLPLRPPPYTSRVAPILFSAIFNTFPCVTNAKAE